MELLSCDLTDDTSVASLGSAIGAAGGGLNLVINTAGLLREAGLAPEKTVRQVTRDNLQRAFATNAFGPILLARELLAHLAAKEAVVFASLSARVGSIGDNRLGGWYAYRASKAAQNQLLRSFAIELARLNHRGSCSRCIPARSTRRCRNLSAAVRPRTRASRPSSPRAGCWK